MFPDTEDYERYVYHSGHQSVEENDTNHSETFQTPTRRSSVATGTDFANPQISTINYNTPDATITKKSYCTPPVLRKIAYASSTTQISSTMSDTFFNPCYVAEFTFAQAVSRLNKNVQRRISFPDQDVLFEKLLELSASSRLDDQHLLAFEFDFPSFFKLVFNCPKKYLLPALALSLQYDEDFAKFLKLFFACKQKFSPTDKFSDNFQYFFLKLFLIMTTVSDSAVSFFSSSKNASFFFSDFLTFPHFYGKFSPHHVADVLSNYIDNVLPDSNVPSNPLKYFILKFNYLNFINSIYEITNFSRISFEKIFNRKNLFSSDEDFDLAIYKSFKYSGDKSQHSMSCLLIHNKVQNILRQALKHQDLNIIVTLFTNLSLENSKNLTLRRFNVTGEPYLTVSVKKISKSFCSIRFEFKNGRVRKPITLILPFN